MVNDFEREVVPILQKALKAMFPHDEPVNGTYYLDVYCDWDDQLSPETITRIAESDDPEEEFAETICEMDLYLDYGVLLRDLSPYLDSRENEILSRYEEEAQNWLWDNVYYRYPREHFLSQSVDVNLILATPGEVNRDFGSYTCFNEWGDGTPDTDCALARIAQILDCEKELFRAVEDPEHKPDHPFAASALDELIEFTGSMGAVTVLAEMSLKDLLSLKTRKLRDAGSLRISKNATMGIFDPWHGGGSILGLELPEDLVVPLSLVWDIWPEGARPHGCDVDEVYGLCGSAWQPDAVSLEPTTV